MCCASIPKEKGNISLRQP